MSSSEGPPTSLLNITEAASLLNVSKATLRRWTNDGRLKCSRIGARAERRFLKSDLMAFADLSQHEAGDASDGAEFVASQIDSNQQHCCIVSRDADEEWAGLGPQILRSIANGDQVLVIGDATRMQRLAALLESNGLSRRDLMSSHALRCVSIEDSYFISGVMQSDRTVAYVESAILEAKARGFKQILIVGSCTWAEGLTGDDIENDLEQYELGLDAMLARHPGASVLCPYTATQMDSRLFIKGLSTHPALQIRSRQTPEFLNLSSPARVS